MSVYIYDKAIEQKLKDILGDSRISIVPFEVAFRKSGANSKDDVKLPFVSVNRTGYSLSTLNKTITGYMVGKPKGIINPDQETYVRNSYIPINVNYTLDVVTRNRQENDELCRELIIYIHRNPELLAEVSYLNIIQRFGFHWFLGDDIVDNSEISDFENRGQYYRSTLSLLVDEAQLLYIKKINPLDDVPENKIPPEFDDNGNLIKDPDRMFTRFNINFIAQDILEKGEEIHIYNIPKEGEDD